MGLFDKICGTVFGETISFLPGEDPDYARRQIMAAGIKCSRITYVYNGGQYGAYFVVAAKDLRAALAAMKNN